MNPLKKYYINQAGGVGGVEPVYSVPTFIQRGHGIGDVLGSIFRSVRYITPYLFSGFKSTGKEAVHHKTIREPVHC